MKKNIIVFLLLMIMILCTSCGDKKNITSSDAATGDEEAANNTASGESAQQTDVDLTQLSSTMVYAEVYNMMTAPDDYTGKKVKMEGQFAVYQDQTTGSYYYAVIIADATACCSQGLEFVLAGENNYPDDYPEQGTEITVTGEFQTYNEGDYIYCHLINAEII